MAEKKVKEINKDSALEDALKEIKKTYGDGSIMKLGERAKSNVDVIPSGSMAIDRALGIGGYPKGRVIEIFGPESSGKTTVALHAIAEAQKKGGKAAFIDAEHAIDPEYAKNLGVNVDELILSQPDYGEQAMSIVEILVKSEAVSLIVVDSVAALVPQAELEGEMLDSQMGLQARMMSKALRKITGYLNKSECTIIFINQLREKMATMGYGNPETTPGGRALKFYSTIRLDVRRIESLKNSNSEVYANKVNVKVVKNKVAAPFKVATIDILFGEGISKEAEVLDIAVETNIVKKSGSYYDYNGERIAQGKENARKYLKEHPVVFEEILNKIKSSDSEEK
ncbi:MAG: recombinase RecA [Bacilli bacterium]|nr:recombinase RecA [Bacilli bacterium]